MADDTQQQQTRTNADKERSRQQSRAVSGKEAAKGSSGTAKSSKGQSPKGGSGPGRSGQGKGKGGQRPPRSASATAAPPRRSPTTLLTWGLVALVLIIVIVLVVVKLTGTSNNSSSAVSSGPVPATVLQEVTHIPTSVYDSVGVSSPTVAVTAPKAVSGVKPLTIDTKPGVFYMGGEFCPYCAAERWAMVASFSRFGSFSDLQTMESSSSDVYPSTQTFTFAQAKLASQYMTLVTREYYSNQENTAGTGYKILQPLSPQEHSLVGKLDSAKYTGSSSTSSGSIPFITIGNKYLISGASFSPSILQGLTREQIAGNLTTTKDPATRAIIATSNYMSAGVCDITGQKPASVCKSSGVTAAAKALKSSS